MAKTKVLVTTTPSLEGWEIETYLGPISAHIVAGTGFFSDFAASFSDVFGGRSQSYQRQLSAINNEVIESLKNKGSLLGATAIVGFRIDHDEISGKSKQMFMVTAYGTAVRAVQLKSHKTTSEKRTVLVSAEEIAVSLKTQSIIAKCQTIPIILSEEERNFTIEHQVSQIAPKILESLQYDYIQYQNTGNQPKIEYERKYFLSLPSELAIDNLYETVSRYDRLFSFVYETISQGDLFDYSSLTKLLASEQFIVQKRALKLAQTDKPFYSYDDISMLSKLIEMIKSTFVVRTEYIEEKSKLTSNIKQKWLCECGVRNDKEALRCSKCDRDIYGFFSSESSPDMIIQLLESKKSVLSKMFSKD
jgi:uncharacterized protein YbjQ (UPF0145 family)